MNRLFFVLYFIFTLFFIFFFPPSIKADFVKSNPNPVLPYGQPNTWDSYEVYLPAAIWINNNGYFWYSGFALNNQQRSIGYAIFSFINNQIAFEKDINNPIIKYNIFSSSDYGIDNGKPITRYINGNLTYLMWVSRVTPGYNFWPYYTSSPDGKYWVNYTHINLSLPSFAGSISAPSVLYNTSLDTYQMLFTSYNMNESVWMIGYAESKDGINWTNVHYPVLKGESDWEGLVISNAHFLLNSDIYYAFYDGSENLYYATSIDGINWNKNKISPLLTKGNNLLDFDNLRIMDPFVIEINNRYYLFYTGANNSWYYNIGLATADSLPPIVTPVPEDTSTPTPTPTATPTTTSTPTPTVTPTPTIGLVNPVIIIPGFGASGIHLP